jgi:tRNA(Arg) A34 adenosine deaminase TadA
MDKNVNDLDLHYLRQAIAMARNARDSGNHPFGAVLADSNGHMLAEAGNTVITTRDCTAHAEMNLLRIASPQYDPATLALCTLYTSTEPCSMCSSAIFWSGITRIVFGVGADRLYEMTGQPDRLLLSCRDLFVNSTCHPEIIGPVMEEEAVQVHEGFWTSA